MQLSVKEARKQLSSLLDRTESGDEVLLSRRGKIIAKIVPSNSSAKKKLPSLEEFRKSIKRSGRSLSQTVIQERRKARY